MTKINLSTLKGFLAGVFSDGADVELSITARNGKKTFQRTVALTVKK